MRRSLRLRRTVFFFLTVGVALYWLQPLPFRISKVEASSTQRVHNANTGYDYVSIQEAIDDPITVNGHTILVDSGVYSERIDIYKSLNLIGYGPKNTVIDGGGIGSVVHINASDVRFAGFEVRKSGSDFLNAGILVDYCSNVNLSRNFVTSCRYGVYVFHSEGVVLEYNNVSMNYEDGIWLYYSGNTTMTGNRMEGNKYNFGIDGQGSADFKNRIDTTNMVDMKPIHYLVNVSEAVFDKNTETGALYLINAVNVTVKDLTLAKNGQDVFCWNATGCRIENVTAAESNYGVTLHNSMENTIIGNRCPDNWVGILLRGSDQNIVECNSAPDNEKGISLYESSHNVLRGNTVSGNLYGIRFFASNLNNAYLNNIVDNINQADSVNSHENTWDKDVEGNFWSDYTGLDANADGIGDTPHYVGEEQDRYPLMGKYYKFEVSHGQETFGIEIVSSSLIADLKYEETEDRNIGALAFVSTGAAQRAEFCRISVPTALLIGPFTIMAGESTDFNATLHSLPLNADEHTLLYFSYNSTESRLAIIGTAADSGPFLQPLVVLALSITAIGLSILVLYVALKRRRRPKSQAADTRTD